MKAIEWLYDKEFEYVFKNIGKGFMGRPTAGSSCHCPGI
jgi:hypothetical protein